MSPKAVRNALERNPSINIINRSAEEYNDSNNRYGCILFNEMLYYTVDPVGLMKKYAKLLSPSGVVL